MILFLLLACGASALPDPPETPVPSHSDAITLDGAGDWRGLLSGASAADAAEAAIAGAQPAVLLTPESPQVSRLPPEALALITPPQLTRDGDAQVLTFWMGQPPGFGPVWVQARVPDAGEVTVEREALDARLSQEAQEAMLLRSLSEGSRKEKQRAAKALGERGSEAAIPGLLALLTDPYAGARGDAAQALGAIASSEASAGLGDALGAETDLAAGMHMVRALQSIGGEDAKAALTRAAEGAADAELAKQARAAAAGI